MRVLGNAEIWKFHTLSEQLKQRFTRRKKLNHKAIHTNLPFISIIKYVL